jgi:hypothetical protein
VNRVAVSIDGRVPVLLAPEDAAALAEVLWRVGEDQKVRGGITLSIALLDAKSGGKPVLVDPSQLSALREALTRIVDRPALAAFDEHLR